MIHCLAIDDVEEPIEYFVSLEKLNKPVNECIGVPEQDTGFESPSAPPFFIGSIFTNSRYILIYV